MALGSFEQLVLAAILRLPGNAYGATLVREIEARTGRHIAVGALYTTLDRLESKGFVRSWMGDPTPERGGRAKRFVEVMEAGQAALEEAWRATDRMRGDGNDQG